jgi:hypothetical protein
MTSNFLSSDLTWSILSFLSLDEWVNCTHLTENLRPKLSLFVGRVVGTRLQATLPIAFRDSLWTVLRRHECLVCLPLCLAESCFAMMGWEIRCESSEGFQAVCQCLARQATSRSTINKKHGLLGRAFSVVPNMLRVRCTAQRPPLALHVARSVVLRNRFALPKERAEPPPAVAQSWRLLRDFLRLAYTQGV